MKRLTLLSAIFLVGMAGLMAQTPAQPAPKPANTPQPGNQKTEAKPAPKAADPKDDYVEAVNAALQSHPDIKAAEAEVLLAQAKLDQVKLKVTQQINALKQARDEAILDLEQAKSMLTLQQKNHDGIEYLAKETNTLILKGITDRAAAIPLAKQMHESEAAMGATKAKIQKLSAEIARLETEIQSYKKSQTARTGFDTWPIKYPSPNHYVFGTIFTPLKAPETTIAIKDVERIQSTPKTSPKTGGVYDTLRQVLGNHLKFGPVKDSPTQDVFDSLIKSADITLKIRVATRGESLTLPAGEMSLSAWFELILDEMTIQNKTALRYNLYIREYGLLLAIMEEAPPDAITASQFLEQVKAEEIEAVKKKIQAEEIEAMKKKQIRAEEEANKKEQPKK